MLTTETIDEFGTVIDYDGRKYAIAPLDADAILVLCWHRNEWVHYTAKPCKDYKEVCESIFYGTVLVERTECARVVFDKFGNIRQFIPRSYYEM